MGSTSSKFKKNLQQGDEYAAMKIYQNSPELRKYLDPNISYGENHNHNTALHYAARHGMKHLLRAFLNDLGGNPNKKNALNETVLHSTCQIRSNSNSTSYGGQERRAACVQLLLHWKGPQIQINGEKNREKIDLSAQDRQGNTPLHVAANFGLRRCVELLVYNGAPLFLENNEKFTPCDLAMRAGFDDIASFLESRMVFADNPDLVISEEDLINEEDEEVYSGLRSQDLQEAKDQLLVDTSDMLKIPLFTAEALLRDNEWSREILLEKWMKNPVECCEQAGVQAPTSLMKHANSLDSSISTDTTSTTNSERFIQEIMCEICLNLIPSLLEWEQPLKMSCKHQFCKICWQSYLTAKIQNGDAHHILCPAFQCNILVPVELIEKLVSPEMARRYLQFDIKAFVESNKSIKWCPIPGCGRAVRLPEIEQIIKPSLLIPPERGALIKNQRILDRKIKIPLTSHAVDCGNAHFFCWECLGEAHAPSGCEQWQKWHQKIAEVKPEELNAALTGSEEAANCLWLVTNSKPCPNCKSPIQKNEGCNHMKCSKCKFDFCWVCQESWKKHSSATGGYFRCNRFEAVKKADEKQGGLVNEAIEKNTELEEITRFLHYYTRFRNHENSQKMEEPLLTSVKKKMEVLALTPHGLLLLGAGSITNKREEVNNILKKSTKFIEDGVRELLKARRVLCGSYTYGYYLEDDGYNKQIFEFMQNELEEMTEKLSEIIARPYLRTPKSVIVQISTMTRRKRHEFVRAVAQGLIPPETPPTLRKKKRKFINDDDDDDDEDATNSWIKESNNWSGADYDTDEETDLSITLKKMVHSPSEEHECGLLCSSQGCGKRPDYNVELIIALEMSRLQMIEDQVKKSNAENPIVGSSISANNNNNNNSSNFMETGDDQLKLAIHLSLQDTDGTGEAPSVDPEIVEQQNSAINPNNLTVNYFLKSLATRKIVDFRTNMQENAETTAEDFRSYCNNEDGRFKISDIHENGYIFGINNINNSDDYNNDEDNNHTLKRCHSTGDLTIRRTHHHHHHHHHHNRPLMMRLMNNGTDQGYSEYYLDSDHSSNISQHEENKSENLVRKFLALPTASFSSSGSAGTIKTTQFLFQQHPEREEEEEEEEEEVEELFEHEDSRIADLEVCGILNTPQQEKLTKNKTEDDNEIKQLNLNNFANLKAKLLCSSASSKTNYLIENNKNLISVNNKDLELINNEDDEKNATTSVLVEKNNKLIRRESKSEKHSPNKINTITMKNKGNKNFSKSTGFLLENNNNNKKGKGLKIRIKPDATSKNNNSTSLETDSSNEYESETGIPKSPTLFISGVSISRTPEPSLNNNNKSAGISSSLIIGGGRQSRSSSLSVPASLINSCTLSISSSSLTTNNNNNNLSNSSSTIPPISSEPSSSSSSSSFTPSSLLLVRSTTPSKSSKIPPSSLLTPAHESPQHHRNIPVSSASAAEMEQQKKSRSANEPEREREMFRFPKSSTDGALSSILHVQESNLSSDDFHEALFLLERSPKTRENSKKRKKIKKTNNNNNNKEQRGEEEPEDITSVL